MIPSVRQSTLTRMSQMSRTSKADSGLLSQPVKVLEADYTTAQCIIFTLPPALGKVHGLGAQEKRRYVLQAY